MKRRPCEICGEDLPITARKHAKVCSNACRQARYRRNRKQRLNPPLVGNTGDNANS